MKIDAILFDLDGTLWEVVDSTYLATKQITDKYNLPEVTKETIIKCMGKTKDECCKLYYPSEDVERGKKLLEEGGFINNEMLKVYGGNVYSGLEETLNELKKKYKLCIVSNCIAGYIEAFLESSKLSKYFDDYIAAGKEKLKKSDAIKEVIKRNNIKNAIYVGDTIKDKEAAKEAKIEFIHARYGFDKNLQSKYYIDDIRNLPLLLKTINK